MFVESECIGGLGTNWQTQRSSSKEGSQEKLRQHNPSSPIFVGASPLIPIELAEALLRYVDCHENDRIRSGVRDRVGSDVNC